MNFAPFPLLTAEDKEESSEGGLDPLGLVPIAEALAVRLVPGVRERMRHPRFLTAMAVGMKLCGRIREDALARDQVTPPSIVFEWLLVEGLVRTAGDDGIAGLPGKLKGLAARKRNVPLSAARYLKSPLVFGFHGVYRGLARDLEIERAGILGETGDQLLAAWTKDQPGLTGFGPGQNVHDALVSAVQDSLKRGEVARGNGWQQWRFFSDHLSPHRLGKRERAVLREALLAEKGHRGDVLQFLVSARGRRAFERNWSEREFHTELRKATANRTLKALLDAVQTYESFARLCQDALDDILYELSRGMSKVTPSQLAKLDGPARACKRVPKLFEYVAEKLASFGESDRFCSSFSSLGERAGSVTWTERLLAHHDTIQSKKPPAGKSRWFERCSDDSVVIRPPYARSTGGQHNDKYVSPYRTSSLYSFARDLGLLR